MSPIPLHVERIFSVPVWNSDTISKTVEFWDRRRIVFSETSETRLVGRRGNILGNWTSFDMTKLRA